MFFVPKMGSLLFFYPHDTINIHTWYYMISYDIHRLMTIPQMNSIWSHVEAVDWIQRWVGVSFGITWFEFQTCFKLFQIMCIFLGTWWNFTDLTNTYENRLMRSCSIQGHAKSLPFLSSAISANIRNQLWSNASGIAMSRPASHCSWCCCLKGQIVPW